MFAINGYHVLQQLYGGPDTLVYRAKRISDNLSVVLKLLRSPSPSPQRLARFRREYDLTAGLNQPGVIKVHDLVQDRGRLIMVMEDIGGESLARLDLAGRLEIDDFLELALQLAAALDQIHCAGLIHKDVNPANIIIELESRRIKLIDFGIANEFARERMGYQPVNRLEGTPAYIAPEQTGRLNCDLDERGDLYGLGATLYELLSGAPPFTDKDPVALIHAHLALDPAPLDTAKPDIPPGLAAVVMKLLAKSPADRYQSANDLKIDLEICQRAWLDSRRIEVFPPTKAQNNRLLFPSKLYGRERETAIILKAFARVAEGERAVVWMTGPSGVGKSVLAGEVYQPITARRGLFASGKFDQLQRDIPHASLVQAFRDLFKQILTETEAQQATWAEKLKQGLGVNLGVISAVIPELKLIVGPHDPVAELEPAENRNRFNRSFTLLTGVLADRNHPLTLFLDDLQWADGASIDLLKTLMRAPDLGHLLILGAFRGDELGKSHPLLNILDNPDNVSMQHLKPAALEVSHVTNFLMDTLDLEKPQTTGLAKLLHARTGGNPFYLKEFIKQLHQDGHIHHDRESGCWCWDIAAIEAHSAGDNVVDLMEGKLSRLDQNTRGLLGIAAVIGDHFELELLAHVCDSTPEQIAEELRPAVLEDLIFPLGENYTLMLHGGGHAAMTRVVCKFAHDRVQQAAHALLEDDVRARHHCETGRQLRAQGVSESNLFQTVYHLNLAQDLITEPEECQDLTRLNQRAGNKAKASGAYAEALHYFQTGLRCVDKAAGNDLGLVREIQLAAAETAYLVGRYDLMEALIQAVLDKAENPLDRIDAIRVQIGGHAAMGDPGGATEIGMAGLADLGEPLPSATNPAALAVIMDEVASLMGDRNPMDLASAAEVSDPIAIACMQLLSKIFVTASTSRRDLYPFLVARQVQISLQYGNMADCIPAYINYGILCASVGEYDRGQSFFHLAMALIDRFEAQHYRPYVLTFASFNIRHWKEHTPAIFSELGEAYAIGLEYGDVNAALVCLITKAVGLYLIGSELGSLCEEMADYQREIVEQGRGPFFDWLRIYRQAALNWTGVVEDPLLLIGEAYNEQEMIPVHTEAADMTSLLIIDINKLMLCYRFGDLDQAAHYAAKLVDNPQPFAITTPIIHMYQALIDLARCDQLTAEERADIIVSVEANQEQMRVWAQHAPLNYAHKCALIDAELARVCGRFSQARDAYDRAVDLAKESGYVHEEALALELAGRYYLERDEPRVAGYYLRDAHYAYRCWGAFAMVRRLERQYPVLLTGSLGGFTVHGTRRHENPDLDLASVIKAHHTISGELVLDRLLEKSLAILLENAGAQRGWLALHEGGVWRMTVEAHAGCSAILLETSLESFPRKPSSVITYVLKTGRDVVLQDAPKDVLFAADPYWSQSKLRSALALAVKHQGQITALLYLEHQLADVFTDDRVTLLHLLASQTAGAIVNARLYADLEKAVAERTKELSGVLERLEYKHGELKRAQTQVVQSQKMASLGVLTAGVAHEINNPNHFVLNAAENLEHYLTRFKETLFQLVDDSETELRKHFEEEFTRFGGCLDRLRNGSSRIDRIIDDLRIFTRHDQADRKTVSIVPGLKSTIRLVSASYGDRVAIETDFLADPMLECRPAQLDQIFLNLILNACQAIEQKTFTRGERGRLSIATVVENQVLVVRFHDNGQGISPNIRDQIFEPFFTTREVGVGRGLGLTISYEIAQQHGGRIEVDSIHEMGSVFSLYLPLSEG